MASGWTARGYYLMLRGYLANQSVPTNFYVALCTDADTPDASTATLADLTEIAAGNGYTSGGYSLSRNTTDFPVAAQDGTAGQASIATKAISWTASGGDIPASGGDARWAVLTTDEGTIANRQVIAWFDLADYMGAASGITLALPGVSVSLGTP